MGVGEADLDEVLLAILGDRLVVVVADDFVADVTSLEAGDVSTYEDEAKGEECLPSKANTTASTGRVTEDAARTHLVWLEDGPKLLWIVSACHQGGVTAAYMLVEVLGDVRHVEVGVTLIGELLELRVEGFLNVVSVICRSSMGEVTYTREADLVAKIVEAADTVLSIFEVVVLDEPEAKTQSQ